MEMRKKLLFVASLCLFGQMALAQQPSTPPDRKVGGWFLDQPIRLNVWIPPFAGGTGPGGPSDSTPDANMYLVGAVAANGVPRTEGDEVIGPGQVLPARDLTVDEFVNPGVVRDIFGYFVVPGPNARIGTNVRVRPMPQGSVVGAPLVYEVKLGSKWYKLSNHSPILTAEQLGLVKLNFFLWGGVYNTNWDFGYTCNINGCP